MALDTSTLLSRRSVLAGTVGGLAALAAAAIGRPAPTRANDPNDVELGASNTSISATAIHNMAEGGTSIRGYKNNTGTAVWGQILDAMSTSPYGAVFGSTNGLGPGVIGENSGTGRGTWGRALGTGEGIYGESTSGRGGRFKGKQAQIRLDPSTARTHPASGSAGDIFLDKSKRLWLCKGGTNWTRLDL